MVGETGADGRYAVCTSLPLLFCFYWSLGECLHGFPRKCRTGSPAPVTRVLQTKTVFYLAVSSDPVHDRIRTQIDLG